MLLSWPFEELGRFKHCFWASDSKLLMLAVKNRTWTLVVLTMIMLLSQPSCLEREMEPGPERSKSRFRTITWWPLWPLMTEPETDLENKGVTWWPRWPRWPRWPMWITSCLIGFGFRFRFKKKLKLEIFEAFFSADHFFHVSCRRRGFVISLQFLSWINYFSFTTIFQYYSRKGSWIECGKVQDSLDKVKALGVLPTEGLEGCLVRHSINLDDLVRDTRNPELKFHLSGTKVTTPWN